jgi:hypothetical protein
MINLLRRFTACCFTPAFEDLIATFALYPNNNTLALGNCLGKKSLNHNFFDPVAVHVW